MEFHRNLIALTQIDGLGPKKIKTILKKSMNPLTIGYQDLFEIGLSYGFIKEAYSSTHLKTADKIIACNEKEGIKTISFWDDDFPKILDLSDGPSLLYYKGNINGLKKKGIGIIGSRRPTQYGFEMAFKLGKIGSHYGFTIISGLALGCDTAGHLGALDEKGETVAFLASGLKEIYPKVNIALGEKIIEKNGCLISEYHVFEKVQSYKFIQRDRLQAMSSDFLITSDFSENSGTMNTLKYGKKCNKKIYALDKIAKNSQNAFLKLDQLKITYETFDLEGLCNLIKNYK